MNNSNNPANNTNNRILKNVVPSKILQKRQTTFSALTVREFVKNSLMTGFNAREDKQSNNQRLLSKTATVPMRLEKRENLTDGVKAIEAIFERSE